MFESLSDRLNDVFSRLRGKGRLSEGDVDATLREVRLALLEADVNVSVARNLLGRIKDRAVGAEITKSLTPAQQVIKIVHEELSARWAIRKLAWRQLRLHRSPSSWSVYRVQARRLQPPNSPTGSSDRESTHCWWPPIFSGPPPSISWRCSVNASGCRCSSTGHQKPPRWSGRR